VNYIDRLNLQRDVLSKQLLSTVLRTEERSRSQFAKELHDGMGPLLSSAKMSLSAISTENMGTHQKDILQNTRFVIDEAIRSVREISNNMSPQVLMDFGLSQGIRNFISRIKALRDVDYKGDMTLECSSHLYYYCMEDPTKIKEGLKMMYDAASRLREMFLA
jgi:signal transduction histidine kinase